MRATLGKSWRPAALALALALLAACNRQPARNGAPEPGDQAVATVDGQTVWASDVKREATADGLIGEGEPLDTSSAMFHQVLDEVIDQKLLAAEAVRRKLQNDPFAKRAIAAARERILGDRLVQSVVAAGVTDQAIEDLYRDHQRLAAETPEYQARQIVSASQADALAIRKQLAQGAAFDALAMEKSTDATTRFNGGDLGYFTGDMMPGAYAAALASAKIGDVIGPFQTDAGWVVLKVEDVRSEQPISMEAARPQIVRFLTYEQVGQLLKKLRGKARVKVLIGPVREAAGAPQEPASAPPESAQMSSAPPLVSPPPLAPAPPMSSAPPSPPPPSPLPPFRSPPPASARAAALPGAPPPPQQRRPAPSTAKPKPVARKVRPSATIVLPPSGPTTPAIAAPPVQPPPVSSPSGPQP